MSDDLALRVTGLTKRFGGTIALDDVYLDIPKGQVVTLVGPSGCGKSTLLRCLTWLEPPDRGIIEIAGRPFGRERGPGGIVRHHRGREIDRKRPQIGLVFQQLNLWPHWSVRANIERPQRIVLGRDAGTARARADELMDQLRITGLAENFPARLSGGQRQRVAIARALAMDPALMLFDEPTSALDPELVGEVLGILRALAARHTTMLVVTHEIGFARAAADRVLFMDKGAIIADGPPAEVMAGAGNPRVRSFFDLVTGRYGPAQLPGVTP
jgi:polar amino acid transport system ATP-binding protein